MKKNIFLRCLSGAAIGLTITIIISIIFSLAIGDGNYYPVNPELIGVCGNEINAVIFEIVLAFVYGAGWGGASVIWDVEKWSLLKRTAVNLVIVSVTTLPVAYFTYWMEHDLISILSYFAIFIGIYAIMWFIMRAVWKKRIKQINDRLNGNNKTN